MYARDFRFNSANAIRQLYEVVTRYGEDIDIAKGRYVIDAKSILGLFSLDMSTGVRIIIHTDNESTASFLFKEVEKIAE